MGKGDKKTKKGKIWKGSYGVSRNKKAIKARLTRGITKPAPVVVVEPVVVEVAKPKAKRAPRKKAAAKE